METILEIEDWKITIEIQPLAKNSENSSSLTRSLMRVAVRKSEKQKGDNSQEGWRKTIVHRFPSNYPFRAKKEKKKKYFYSGRTIVRRLLHSPARRVMLSRHRSLRARPLNRGWQKNGETNCLKEKGEIERKREGKGETEARTCGCVHARAREREGKNGEKRWRRYKVRGSGSISGIAILLLAPLLIARPLKIMNVNYA